MVKAERAMEGELHTPEQFVMTGTQRLDVVDFMVNPNRSVGGSSFVLPFTRSLDDESVDVMVRDGTVSVDGVLQKKKPLYVLRGGVGRRGDGHGWDTSVGVPMTPLLTFVI